MNNDLISRKELLEKAGWVNLYGENRSAHVVFSKDIHEAPAVDVVQVVRCKDCSSWGLHEKSLSYDCYTTDADDYCSAGRRKTVEIKE